MKRRDREAADAELERLYAQVPVLDCKGLCYSSCGLIECSTRERERMADAGVTLPSMADQIAAAEASPRRATCPALSLTGRCTVYAVRPMVCRLWGATAGMPCVYGCRPVAGRLLSHADGLALLGGSLETGGAPTPRMAHATAESMRAFALRNPGMIAELFARGQVADRRRTRLEPDER